LPLVGVLGEQADSLASFDSGWDSNAAICGLGVDWLLKAGARCSALWLPY